MKTVTAKELQTNSKAILQGLREGQEYRVTFHKKPIGRLVPEKEALARGKKKPPRGSYEAVLESLKHTVQATGDLYNLTYKELRDRMMEEKHGGHKS